MLQSLLQWTSHKTASCDCLGRLQWSQRYRVATRQCTRTWPQDQCRSSVPFLFRPLDLALTSRESLKKKNWWLGLDQKEAPGFMRFCWWFWSSAYWVNDLWANSGALYTSAGFQKLLQVKSPPLDRIPWSVFGCQTTPSFSDLVRLWYLVFLVWRASR